MLEMNFGCEAEIFASDLRFNMFDDSTGNIYKGQVPLKNEDQMTSLKARLNKIIELFQGKFSDLHNKIQLQQAMADSEFGQTTGQNVDENLELHLAIAVYMATYADGNMATKEFYQGLEGELQGLFFQFLKGVLDDSHFDLDFKGEMEGHIDTYRATMKRIVNGDIRLQTKMLSIRKFFSCPWLVCPDLLLLNLQ